MNMRVTPLSTLSCHSGVVMPMGLHGLDAVPRMPPGAMCQVTGVSCGIKHTINGRVFGCTDIHGRDVSVADINRRCAIADNFKRKILDDPVLNAEFKYYGGYSPEQTLADLRDMGTNAAFSTTNVTKSVRPVQIGDIFYNGDGPNIKGAEIKAKMSIDRSTGDAYYDLYKSDGSGARVDAVPGGTLAQLLASGKIKFYFNHHDKILRQFLGVLAITAAAFWAIGAANAAAKAATAKAAAGTAAPAVAAAAPAAAAPAAAAAAPAAAAAAPAAAAAAPAVAKGVLPGAPKITPPPTVTPKVVSMVEQVAPSVASTGDVLKTIASAGSQLAPQLVAYEQARAASPTGTIPPVAATPPGKAPTTGAAKYALPVGLSLGLLALLAFSS